MQHEQDCAGGGELAHHIRRQLNAPPVRRFLRNVSGLDAVKELTPELRGLLDRLDQAERQG